MVNCTQDIDVIKNISDGEKKESLTNKLAFCCKSELYLLCRKLLDKGAEVCEKDISFNARIANCNEIKQESLEYQNILREYNDTEQECDDKLNIPKYECVNENFLALNSSFNSASSLEVSGILSAAAVMVGYYLLS